MPKDTKGTIDVIEEVMLNLLISKQSKENQEVIRKVSHEIVNVVTEHGELGMMAFALTVQTFKSAFIASNKEMKKAPKAEPNPNVH